MTRPPQAAEAKTRRRLIAIAYWLLVLTAVPFGVFAYNCTYGYDQIEYLLLGRSLADGYALFDLIPSKSPGIYLLTWLLLAVGLPAGRATVALAIAIIYLLLVAATYAVVRRRFDSLAALFAAALVAAAAAFMELNFLEPEGPVYLFGLAAFALAIRGLERAPARHLFAAGLMLALGFQFKSVAGFYGIGMLAFLVGWLVRNGRMKEGAARWIPALVAGSLIGLLLPLAYFALTARADECWLWTIRFPVFEYPANTFYLYKLWTKLPLFVVLFAAALLGSLLPGLRRAVYGDRAAVLALCMGIAGLGALLKTQASHYYFPGAAFLCIFTAVVARRALELPALGRISPWKLAIGPVVVVALLILSAVLYRPSVFGRLIALENFAVDESIAAYIQRHVPADGRALFFRDSTYLYWVSHRYPNVPFVNMDVQTTFYLEDHGDALIEALDDRALRLVEFDPDEPGIQDEYFMDDASRRAGLEVFRRKLAELFTRDPNGPERYVFWVRKAGQE